MSDDARESVRFDGPPGAHGWALRAASGPSRWAAVRAAGDAHRVAYAADGETIRCIVGAALHTLDRRGRAIAPPRTIGSPAERVVLAAWAPRALVIGPEALRVVALDEDRVLWTRAMRAPPGLLALTARGAHVVSEAGILGVDDGIDRTFDGRVRAASPDGALVLVEDRFRRTRLVRASDGSTVRDDVVAAEVWDLVLDAHGACAMVERRHSASAWHDRSGTSPEWDDGSRVRVATPAGDGRVILAVSGLVPIPTGGWLGRSRRGVVRIERDASFRVLPAHGAVLAVSPDGSRAIVSGASVGEIDLASGTFLSSGDASTPTEIAWSPSGDRALVAYDDGRLERWDVASWTSELVTRRCPAGPMACATDGAIVIVAHDACVTCLEPTGATRWRHTLRPPSLGGSPCAPRPAIVEGSLVSVDTRWSRLLGTSADREEIREETDVRTHIDLVTGAARESVDSPSATYGGPSSYGHELRRAPGWDPVLGRPTSVWPSPDERRVLVATDAGRLLRLDRVSPTPPSS